jgi:Restriction endonuclease
MPLITSENPASWEQLETLVTSILAESGMNARRNVTLSLPRGTVEVDVLAEDSAEGIVHRLICECKNWKNTIPKEVVHAFRTVMQETGAHRGYIVSRAGFQAGAHEAAQATNIELVTFVEFQERYFSKWFKKKLWSVEDAVEDFNEYYEPLGPPGWSNLTSEERRSYQIILDKYLFAGLALMFFSPYSSLMEPPRVPPLPFAFAGMEERGVIVPANIKSAAGYQEFFDLLENYAEQGLEELREVNPIFKGRSQ